MKRPLIFHKKWKSLAYKRSLRGCDFFIGAGYDNIGAKLFLKAVDHEFWGRI